MKMLNLNIRKNRIDCHISDESDYDAFCLTEIIGGRVGIVFQHIEASVIEHNELENEIEL